MKTGITNSTDQQVTPYLWVFFGVCFISSAFGGVVSTLMSVYLPFVIKDLQLSSDPGEQARVSAYINAVFIFGWAIGGLVWGMISDRMGRKRALLLAIGSYAVFTILTGVQSNWWSIVLCRIMSGFGVGGVLVIGFTFMSEVWPAKSKAIFIGILSIAFPVGIFSAGLINYLVPSWRQAFLSGIVPLALALASAGIIKESTDWKKDKQDIQNNSNPAESLFSAGFRKDLLIGSVTFGSMLIGLWAIFLWLPTWVQSLIAGSDGRQESGITMMLLGMGGLTGGFFSGWFLNAVGTRKAMLICFAVCSLMSFVLFKTNTVFTNMVYIETGVLAFFFGISQGVLSFYIPQLFPTNIRATATGFCFNIGRLFTGTAVLFVGVLVTTLGGYGNAIYLFSLVFVFGLFVVLLMRKMEHKLV